MSKEEAMIHTLIKENDELKMEISRLRQAIEQEPMPILNEIKDYINHIRNTGLGKKKSLEFIEKYIDGLKSESDDKITKAELMLYVGKKVHIYFKNKDKIGILGYVDKVPEKFGYRKLNYFYIGNLCFKASDVKKVIESES